MIYLDRLIRQGSTHNICEDYAYIEKPSNLDGNFQFRISDGCSSTPGSELRAIELASKGNKDRIFSKPGTFATLLSGVYAPSLDFIHILISGDGLAVIKLKTFDRPFFIHTEFKNNAPYYLDYYADAELTDKWKEISGEKITVSNIPEEVSSYIDVNSIGVGYLTNIRIKNASEHLDFCVVSSDGILTLFDDKKPFLAEYDEEKLTSIFSLKQLQGEFLQRRINSFFRKNPTFHNKDDVSLAGISFV